MRSAGAVQPGGGAWGFPTFLSLPPTPPPPAPRAGSTLIEEVLDAVPAHPDIKEVYLHVWTANDGALRFYERLGFTRGEEIPNYYRGISPNTGVVLRKAVNIVEVEVHGGVD